jgi:hypothetical protein
MWGVFEERSRHWESQFTVHVLLEISTSDLSSSIIHQSPTLSSMATPKLYVDHLSQPCRSCLVFCRCVV